MINKNPHANNEQPEETCPREASLEVKFTGLSHYLDKLEAMPSSMRYFEDVYEIGLTIMSLLGNPGLKGLNINVGLLAETEDAENLWYMNYSRPFTSSIDSFLIERISDKGKLAVGLQRKRGHLAIQEEKKVNYTPFEIFGRRLFNKEYIEMQPYRVYKGNSKDNLKLAHEF